MKKRFLTILAVMSAIIMCIAVFAVSAYHYSFYKSEIQKEVAMAAQILATNKSFAGLSALDGPGVDQACAELAALNKNVSQKLRLTLVAQGGRVLYDSSASGELLENHQDRQELRQAFQLGAGSATRYSETVGKDTYYYALKLSHTLVLRVAKEMTEATQIVYKSLPIILVLLVLLLLVSLLAANFLVNKALKSLYDTLAEIKNLFAKEEYDFASISCYDEIAPFVKEIKSLNLQTKRHLKDLQLQRDTIDNITKNIAEGWILLDHNRKILAINKSAKKMLGASATVSAVDANILTITRSLELQKALDLVFPGAEGENAENAGTSFVEKTQNDRYYHYLINGVRVASHGKGGIMILILDITKEVKAENMRREFAANVSHELKTPLTTISGFAEMMAAGLIQNPDEVIRANSLILKESRRLVALIDDILRLSLIETNQLELEIEEISFADLLTEVGANLREIEKNKEIALTVDFSACPALKLEGNYPMLYELIYNLGENAIKYNKPQGKVKIALSQEGEFARLSLEDTGIGIAPWDLDHICERFYRADKSRSKETGGTGLGLSIVKHIVEYHQGTIEIASKLNEGTNFVVKLPFKFKKL